MDPRADVDLGRKKEIFCKLVSVLDPECFFSNFQIPEITKFINIIIVVIILSLSLSLSLNGLLSTARPKRIPAVSGISDRSRRHVIF
jgi:hypothetical protein